MSMPRGAKIKGGYATISDDPMCMNFRTISEIMTHCGHKMNHASVRNYLLRGMRKFAVVLSSHYGLELNEQEIDVLARNPVFQESVRSLVQNEFDFQELAAEDT